jgi:hypothetical protein
MKSLAVDRDLMVENSCANLEARDVAYLLPDDISKRSVKSQQDEVKAIISICPEYLKSQKKVSNPSD